jgi:hypothetical protein
MESRPLLTGGKKSGFQARSPMVIKRRRELRRQGQFGCPKCQATLSLADCRKCCGACPRCCVCQGAKVVGGLPPDAQQSR